MKLLSSESYQGNLLPHNSGVSATTLECQKQKKRSEDRFFQAWPNPRQQKARI